MRNQVFLFLKFIVAFVSYFHLSSAWGHGTEVGNGGVGVVRGGKIILLDLVEFQGGPVVVASKGDPAAVEKFRHELSISLDPRIFPVELLAQELVLLNNYYPRTSAIILSVINLYRWSLTEEELRKIGSDLETSLAMDPADLRQIAVRGDKNILISRNSWQQMEDVQKAAFVFHEVLYALYLGQQIEIETGDLSRMHANRRARETNAALWTGLVSRSRAFENHWSDLPGTGKIGDGWVGRRWRSDFYEVLSLSQSFLIHPIYGMVSWESLDEAEWKSLCGTAFSVPIEVKLESIMVNLQFDYRDSYTVVSYGQEYLKIPPMRIGNGLYHQESCPSIYRSLVYQSLNRWETRLR